MNCYCKPSYSATSTNLEINTKSAILFGENNLGTNSENLDNYLGFEITVLYMQDGHAGHAGKVDSFFETNAKFLSKSNLEEFTSAMYHE